MADIISGYLIWAPFTIVIKGLMAFIAGTIIYKNKKIMKIYPQNYWDLY